MLSSSLYLKQKQRLHLEQQLKQKEGSGAAGGRPGKSDVGKTQLAKFTVGTDDDESEGSGTQRNEIPMGEDEVPVSESSVDRISEIAAEYGRFGG